VKDKAELIALAKSNTNIWEGLHHLLQVKDNPHELHKCMDAPLKWYAYDLSHLTTAAASMRSRPLASLGFSKLWDAVNLHKLFFNFKLYS